MSKYESRAAAAGDSSRTGRSSRFSPESRARAGSGYDQDQQQPPLGLNASYYHDTAEALGLPLTPGAAQPQPPQGHPSFDLIRMTSHHSADSRSSSPSPDRGRGPSRTASCAPDPLERARSIF